MPWYEYRCQKCRSKFDMILPLRDRLNVSCPNCGGRVKQLVSVPCIHGDDLGIDHVDPTFGPVSSRQKLRELEKKSGLRRREPGDQVHYKRIREANAEKQAEIREKIIGETVSEFF